MLSDFRNYFRDRLSCKFATNSYLNIPPHLICRYTTLWNMNVHLKYEIHLGAYSTPSHAVHFEEQDLQEWKKETGREGKNKEGGKKNNSLQRLQATTQPGWTTSMMTCLHWILGCMRLEIWHKIYLSADWCLCTALCTRSGACYYWTGNSYWQLNVCPGWITIKHCLSLTGEVYAIAVVTSMIHGENSIWPNNFRVRIFNVLAHTHTHPFNGPFSGTTRVSRYQKGKNNLDFTEAGDSEWQWHQLGHMQACT